MFIGASVYKLSYLFINCVYIQKRSISACSSYSSDDDVEQVVSEHTRDDVTSGTDEPLLSADDVISEIESMMEVCRCIICVCECEANTPRFVHLPAADRNLGETYRNSSNRSRVPNTTSTSASSNNKLC